MSKLPNLREFHWYFHEDHHQYSLVFQKPDESPGMRSYQVHSCRFEPKYHPHVALVAREMGTIIPSGQKR